MPRRFVLQIVRIACAMLFSLILLGGWGVSVDTAAPLQAPEEPPAPKATSSVQKVLDEATAHAQAKRPTDALAAAERARHAAEQGKDDVGAAQAQRQRAQTLQALNRNDEAVAVWRAAAAAWEQVGDGPGQIEALATAGLLLEAQQPDEAAALRSQTLALGRAEAKRPLAAAQALHAAGQSYYARRRLGPAREFWTVALAIRERQAPNSLDVAASLNTLGIVADLQGNLAAAKEYHQRALAIQEQQAPGSLAVAVSLHNLGMVASQQENLAVAKDYHQRARALQIAGARSVVGSQWAVKDSSTATLMVALHRYLRQGLAKDAALQRAMADVRRNPDTAHPYYWAGFMLLGDPDNPTLGRPRGSLSPRRHDRAATSRGITATRR